MKIDRKFKRAGLAVATAAALTGMTSLSAAAEEWRGWNIHVPDYPVSLGMEAFAKEVAEKTNGRIEPKPYHGGVLGSQPDAIEQVRAGAIQWAVFNLGPMGPFVPETNVVNLPFIFKSVDHMHRVMDGPIGDEISAAMAKEGLVALGWYDSGSRSFYNSKGPINTPADVKGLKVRVMNNELFVGMIEALGGNATPMAFSEVFQSLKTGVVDGAENNWPSYESTNHFQVAGYYSASDHLILPECLCINTGVWEGLSDADKKIVKDAGRASAELQRKLWAEREKASRAKVEAAGVKFNDIADKSAFQKAMAPVYDKAVEKNPALKSLIEKIRAQP
jgi:tripartite ATP-independent transporter DctP family solute receptor